MTAPEQEALRLAVSNDTLSTMGRYYPSASEHAAAMRELRAGFDCYTARVSVAAHAVSLETAAYLLWLCRSLNARRVLDLGSGFSSSVLNKYAVESGAEVVSVDTDPVWMARSREFTPTGTYVLWDDFRAAEHEPFDVVFHDLAGGDVRTDAVPYVASLVAPGGVAVFDDAHHDEHRAAMWAAPGLAVYSTHQRTLDQFARFAMIGVRLPHETLAGRYAELCAEPSDIYLHLPRFVEMVHARNAQHVVELGTRTGVSTVAWLYALERTGGRLTSVDLDGKPPIGDHPHWTFIQGDDMDPAISAGLEPCDILFVDTSHHFQHTLRELHTYRWLVKPGGLIVCHDTELPVPEGAPPGDPLFPVKRAVELFCRETGFQWSNVPECWGLGIIEVV